jgi:hypothetical protein
MSVVEHAKARASERYEVRLNRDKYYSLIHKIRANEAVSIKRVSNSRSVYLVDGFVVVYSKSRKKIITFLPPDCKEMRDYANNKNSE